MRHPVAAPEIAIPGLEWFNVEAPLALSSLRGKLVVLDFWTFCCINCMHVLPILKRIEQRFPREVAVIGVHSPKFAAEREPGNLADALARYGVVHPVVHDPDFLIWRQYGVRAWPTLVFIAPDGGVIDQVSGEPDPERIVAAVGGMVERARAGGVLAPASLELKPATAQGGALAFPGKMKRLDGAGEAAGWALTDGGHHQIVLLDGLGTERERVGSGARGFGDGGFREASFDGPQGLAAAADTLYVADTGNHAIRKIDLAAGRVTTLAGNGRRGPVLAGAQAAAAAVLASPWDLEVDGERLYFANAGSHQLGLLDLGRGTVERLAGDGDESIEDGAAATSRLAQPSGLSLSADRGILYFVDSETSSVRALRLGPEPHVTTLIGTGLFDFGHVNGDFAGARFQHPLGIVSDGARLLVADSYNGALRVLDLGSRRVSDLDDGFACEDEVCLPSREPAGVAADGNGGVFMVDTNNHRVVLYRPAERAYRTWFA